MITWFLDSELSTCYNFILTNWLKNLCATMKLCKIAIIFSKLHENPYFSVRKIAYLLFLLYVVFNVCANVMLHVIMYICTYICVAS